MKQFNSFQRWRHFLMAHKLVSFIALTLIIFSSFASSLFVSHTFSARADTTNSVPPPAVGTWDLNGANGTATIDSNGNLQLTPPYTNGMAGSAFWPTVLTPSSLTASF